MCLVGCITIFAHIDDSNSGSCLHSLSTVLLYYTFIHSSVLYTGVVLCNIIYLSRFLRTLHTFDQIRPTVFLFVDERHKEKKWISYRKSSLKTKRYSKSRRFDKVGLILIIILWDSVYLPVLFWSPDMNRRTLYICSVDLRLFHGTVRWTLKSKSSGML